MASTPIHALRVSEVFQEMQTRPDGLALEEVQARLRLYGPNTLPEPPTTPLWRRLIVHVTYPMALALWIAGLLALFAGQPTLTGVIWIVVVLNAGFSFWQEYRAEQAVAALSHLLPIYAHIVRGGQEMSIPASDVVPGDILVLAQGNNIPADARVIEQYGLRTNQAALTGEAVAAAKTAEASLREGLTTLERPNLVFAGTSVVSGTGRAIVYATGALTQIGRIANLTQEVQEEPSPLQREITRITRILSLFALAVGAMVFAVGIMEVGISSLEAFILAIGIIVAALPEGLRPTVTLSLAIAVERLARRGVLVKKLAMMETLGKISVICTDKGGTLTHNQMTIRELWVAGHQLQVSGEGYEPIGQFVPDPTNSPFEGDLMALLTAAILCNNARLIPPTPDRPRWACLGDQTEAALRALALKGGISESAAARTYPRIHELPFDATRKRMSTIHRSDQGEVAFVKGAPKEVLQCCTHILVQGKSVPLDEDTYAAIVAANDNFARNALRVLALAKRDLPPRSGPYSVEGVEQGLTFLGLVAMMDPPRPEVAQAIQVCRAAGLRMVMITGDYGLTAESLARRIGMLSAPHPRIVTGSEVDSLSEEELQSLLDEEVIFARVAPEHKLRVVAAFQSRGEVVAVSGDGVNDGPALRKADVGVAMGISGTDVARQAADIVLTDDNFGAIVSAIEEGRAIYDNIRKFITYILASNVPEIVPFILTSLTGLPLALTVAQILVIDLGTDLLPGLALGAERPEPEVMHRPPRPRNKPLLDAGLVGRSLWLGGIETALCYIGFLTVYHFAGYTDFFALPHPDQVHLAQQLTIPAGRVYVLATTVFFAGVVMAQAGNAFTCRKETQGVHRLGWLSNRLLLVGIAFGFMLTAALIYLPPLARVFEHLPVPAIYWIGLAAYGPVLYTLDRVRKEVASRIRRMRRLQQTEGGAR